MGLSPNHIHNDKIAELLIEHKNSVEEGLIQIVL